MKPILALLATLPCTSLTRAKGEVLCNDIPEFGATWLALTAEGEPPPA